MSGLSYARLLAASVGGLMGVGSNGAVIASGRLLFRSVRDDPAKFERRQFEAYRQRMMPHAAPTFVAICRSVNGRRYHHCATRDQALAHGPYLIEHVNGYGQVTRRERFR